VNILMSDITINDILEEFLAANQKIYTKLESLNLTLESVEIIMVPTERRQFVRVKEFAKNSLQTHQKERPLAMQSVDFDKHMKRHSPPGVQLRQYDQRNLDAQTIKQILGDSQAPQDNQVNGDT
jgi:hypothetical protein